MMKATKVVLVITAFSYLSLFGCSSSDSGSSDSSSTAATFPDVAGTYALNTSTVPVSCTDGSSSSIPPISMNMNVGQTSNSITAQNATFGASGIPGITVLSSTGLKGTVQTNSSFIMNESISANIDGILGTVSIQYNLTGSFTANGWSGTYTYTLNAPSEGGSCTAKTSFSGSKISGKPAARSIGDMSGMHPDIYDSYGHFARSLGL